MAPRIDYLPSAPMSQYGAYPTSYEPEVFSTAGMGEPPGAYGQYNDYPSSYDDAMGGVGAGYKGPAIVTTQDAAPAGDLQIRDVASSNSIRVGVASKGATVEVLGPGYDGVTDSPVPGWVQIAWGGDARNPPGSGYVKADFLTASYGPPPSIPGLVNPPPSPSPVAPSASGLSTVAKVALGLGVAAAIGAVYMAFKD